MGLLAEKNMSVSESFILPKVYLIVGLGNIGAQYANNRHNVGFLSVDHLQKKQFSDWKEKSRLKASIATKEVNGNKVILAKPDTMMNLSGNAVIAIAQFYRINPEDILVIYDEADIDFGMIRARMDGGSAGHNGMRSIIQHLGEDFARIRVGVANETIQHQDKADFVLSNFSKDEQAQFEAMFTVIEKTVNKFITSDFSDDTDQF